LLAVFASRYIGDPDAQNDILEITMAEENAVSLKPPTFWTSQPQVWFAEAEAQFEIGKIIAAETKYYNVISVLE